MDKSSEAFARNRSSLLQRIALLDEQLAAARAGGGDKYVERHRSRDKMPVRERLDLLLDRGSPFLELSALAGWGASSPSAPASSPGLGSSRALSA
ncbi:hypothetical protein [Nocardioides alcanivorans]|uniref:hypothetical protein n=1 Tax=Nocardioides alcanivorans TaxID=2897352 RepID=UPI0028A01D51|nr:hypothetical protein [Nocardioides alcanivorans]